MALVTAASCGSGSGDGRSRVQGTTTKVTVRPGTAKGFVGARADVTALVCSRAGSSWHVSGMVSNPTRRPASYRIYVSFVTTSATTIGLLQTDLKRLAAGASSAWSGQLPVQGSKLRCILRVERTRA